MANNIRTMAFQIPEDLFQRVEAHLERETALTGKKLTQRGSVPGLIEEALDERPDGWPTPPPARPRRRTAAPRPGG